MKKWQELCLSDQVSIFQAMKVLNETAEKFLIVTSIENLVLGSVTDGDIRRAMLSGARVEDSILKALNPNPITCLASLTRSEMRELMNNCSITHIPVVDEKGKLLKIFSLKELQSSELKKENAIILMVGGLGSRLGDLTANCPKPMLKLGDKPILEIIIENFKEYGFHNFYLSVNYKSEIIESYFKNGENHGVSISYIREKERMGTAGSLTLFEPINDLPVIVMNGDVLTKINYLSLIDFQVSNQFDTCICTFRHDFQIPYGVVHFDGDLVLKIEEKPIHTSLVNAGVYSINPKLLSLIPRDSFYDMPTFLEKLISENYRVGKFQLQDYWHDIGRHDDLIRAVDDYVNKIK